MNNTTLQPTTDNDTSAEEQKTDEARLSIKNQCDLMPTIYSIIAPGHPMQPKRSILFGLFSGLRGDMERLLQLLASKAFAGVHSELLRERQVGHPGSASALQ